MSCLARSTARRGTTILLISVIAAACSGGGASSTAGSITAPGGSQPPAASTTTEGSPSLEIARYCNAIKLHDAQALVKDTIIQDYFEPLASPPPYERRMLNAAGDIGSDLDVALDPPDPVAGRGAGGVWATL